MDLDDRDLRPDMRCGLMCCAPRWMGRLASAKTFLVVYGFLGTLQAMAYIYFVATLTTLEKRFKIPSQTTGIMMSGNEVSQILLSLFLTYWGGRGNRPLWIAWGVALSALSCLILALPHLVYGPGREALLLTKEFAPPPLVAALTSENKSFPLAQRIGSLAGERLVLCSNGAMAEESLVDRDGDRCEVDGDLSVMPLCLVFLSQFVLGIGSTLYFALGQTYLDDNTAKRKTPMLLGMVLALRTVGPALGFLLGWACLNLYIDPSLTPLITKKDPRWLGAWWLGWIMLALAMFLFSLLMAMFPRHLQKRASSSSVDSSRELQDASQPLNDKGKGPEEEGTVTPWGTKLEIMGTEEKEDDIPKLRDFPVALGRLLRNRILMVNNFAGVFYILGASGYITFMTKYMETQFQQSAASANIIVGTAGIMAMVAGFLVSGVAITKYRPRPRLILAWNVFVGVAYILGELCFIFLGCSSRPLHGSGVDGSLTLDAACNTGCGCDQFTRYSPVCSADGQLAFYSACHAGCKFISEDVVTADTVGLAPSSAKATTRRYGNCSCIPEPPSSFLQDLEDGALRIPSLTSTSGMLGWDMVTEGPCAAPDCASPLMAFLIISCVMHFLGSSGKVGNVLVNYRSVIPEDKAFAQGLTLLLVSLLAFIPGPILYGAIIDDACLIWDMSCGSRGNCWLYHKEYFRFYLNSTAAFFTTIAVILDGVVCYLGKDLEFYKETGKIWKTTDNK